MAVISLIILATYLIAMGLAYGVREYVSDNYYIGKHPWLFSVVMAVSGGLMLPPLLEKGGDAPFLALFAVFGLLIVALAPHYKVDKMHAVGAFTALICGVMWAMSFHTRIVACVAMAWCCYWAAKLPKPFYVGEVLAFALIYGTLLI